MYNDIYNCIDTSTEDIFSKLIWIKDTMKRTMPWVQHSPVILNPVFVDEPGQYGEEELLDEQIDDENVESDNDYTEWTTTEPYSDFHQPDISGSTDQKSSTSSRKRRLSYSDSAEWLHYPDRSNTLNHNNESQSPSYTDYTPSSYTDVTNNDLIEKPKTPSPGNSRISDQIPPPRNSRSSEIQLSRNSKISDEIQLSRNSKSSDIPPLENSRILEISLPGSSRMSVLPSETSRTPVMEISSPGISRISETSAPEMLLTQETPLSETQTIPVLESRLSDTFTISETLPPETSGTPVKKPCLSKFSKSPVKEPCSSKTPKTSLRKQCLPKNSTMSETPIPLLKKPCLSKTSKIPKRQPCLSKSPLSPVRCLCSLNSTITSIRTPCLPEKEPCLSETPITPVRKPCSSKTPISLVKCPCLSKSPVIPERKLYSPKSLISPIRKQCSSETSITLVRGPCLLDTSSMSDTSSLGSSTLSDISPPRPSRTPLSRTLKIPEIKSQKTEGAQIPCGIVKIKLPVTGTVCRPSLARTQRNLSPEAPKLPIMKTLLSPLEEQATVVKFPTRQKSQSEETTKFKVMREVSLPCNGDIVVTLPKIIKNTKRLLFSLDEILNELPLTSQHRNMVDKLINKVKWFLQDLCQSSGSQDQLNVLLDTYDYYRSSYYCLRDHLNGSQQCNCGKYYQVGKY